MKCIDFSRIIYFQKKMFSIHKFRVLDTIIGPEIIPGPIIPGESTTTVEPTVPAVFEPLVM
jgi:hypothetical protein